MDNSNPVVEGKVWALMGYLWILCLIPLIMKRDNPFVLFHAKQGLLLFVGSIIFSIAAIIPLVGIIAALGNMLVLIFCITGIMNVLVGKYWKVPVIGDIAATLDF